MQNADHEVRIAGLECLASMKRDPGVDAVTRALRDPVSLVRVAALELVAAGVPASSALLERLVSSDPTEVVRAYAGWAIARSGSRQALPTLRKRLLVEQSAVVRSGLLEALYLLSAHPPYLDMLFAGLTSSDPDARAFTSNAVLGVAARENIQRIIEALRSALAEETFPTIAETIRHNLETAEDMQRDDDYELE
ncbi:MAG: HEAT repeat domain-containing protein [Myxococcales bacterium]|nr:HEAT repeat domain-containing protein [Myxococcales bacterium]